MRQNHILAEVMPLLQRLATIRQERIQNGLLSLRAEQSDVPRTSVPKDRAADHEGEAAVHQPA